MEMPWNYHRPELEKGIIKLNWQKRFWIFYYGWDSDFGTGIIKNECSFAISVKGYWIGI